MVDLDLGPKWEFNAGVGFGLTPSSDRLIVKMILGYRFDGYVGSGRPCSSGEIGGAIAPDRSRGRTPT